jgi:hypothetical protein
MQDESRSVSRILFFGKTEAAIIHLAQPSPVGSSDLPGGRSALLTARIGRAALFDASLFGLALRGVCLAAGVTTERRCALTATVSPITRNRLSLESERDPLAGLFSVALVVIRQGVRPKGRPFLARCPAVSWLAAL